MAAEAVKRSVVAAPHATTGQHSRQAVNFGVNSPRFEKTIASFKQRFLLTNFDKHNKVYKALKLGLLTHCQVDLNL